jgi:ankyrin repeat protein
MDDDGQAPLFEAIRKGDAERVRSLVAASPALAQARDENGVQALLVAKYERQVEVEAVLVELLPEDALDVFAATAMGRVNRVTALLDEDASLVTQTTPDGFTALHYAAFFQQQACAALLVERGADVNAASDNPMKVQPLHSAAAARDLALVELLLDRGADPNAQQQDGFTALHAAAQHGDVAVVRTLLNHGANPHLANEEGRTAKDFARASGDAATEALLD